MNKTLLIIGSVWPEPRSSAAGSRMLQLIDVFQLDSYNITFASACAKTNNAFDLTTLGIVQKEIVLNDSSFDTFVEELQPDIVLFDRFMTEEQFGWRVAEQCPNTVKILDTEDLHCLRKGRQHALKDKAPFNGKYVFSDTAKREIASILRCDMSLIISEYEMELLRDTFKIDRSILCYVPFLLEEIPSNKIEQLPTYEARNHFVTIGNFLHPPNVDAVQYLKQDIWPIIRKELPQAEMHIYGAYASDKISQLSNEKDGFIIKGFTEDVNEVMKHAKLCLAPLRFGAGLKGKLIDAMINGTPCVMTNIASEGMFGDLESNGCITDDSKEFAEQSIALLSNESLWKEKQRNGFRVINDRFNKELFSKNLKDRVDRIQRNLKQHRQSNFVGQMLQHHTLQSSKYMSKWIEEKNRK